MLRHGAVGGPGAMTVSQMLNFRGPVKIGDIITVIVTVAELIPEKSRARLTCVCKVGRQVVLDGEALVKVPREEKGKRPLIRLLGLYLRGRQSSLK
jgi:3-hydroxybutyryl-CoA dehydratase